MLAACMIAAALSWTEKHVKLEIAGDGIHFQAAGEGTGLRTAGEGSTGLSAVSNVCIRE